MRKIWLAPALALAALPAWAHDFWRQPRQFTLPAPGTALLTLFVGHGTFRDRWPVGVDHVVRFTTTGADGVIDRRKNLMIGAPGFDGLLPLARPGAYVVAMQSTETPSQLPFLRFNDYINFEGITPIIETRRRLHQEQADGREIYSRRAKAIIQVGPVDAGSIERVTHPVGLSLEIVPLRHPFRLDGHVMPVQILLNGRPLSGALVKLTDLDADAEPVAKVRSGGDGRAAFTIPHPGKWQFNVVWSLPVKNNPQGDFQTTFTSLAFATQ